MVRTPAVAGIFYPSDPDELLLAVRGFLHRAEKTSFTSPKALIVPHAGYIYSGAVAASAYAQIEPEGIERVVLLGPAHILLLQALAVPETITWGTPIGDVMIDFQAVEKISTFPQVVFSEKAHQDEHSLEVQLPFLQEVLGKFKLVPMTVGDVSPEQVSGVLDAVWGGPETLIVVSSDLSHYKSYEQAMQMDQKTAKAIVNLDFRGLDPENACGLSAIAGLIYQARQRMMRVELLDLRNSGDTAGEKDQVVGYGAFAFYE
ncbi:MAG: AmmeMemoRadiSam system protein B [Kiritimatiellales bacterium]|nr:AmmeMemoRadiSam system protein B [Kiritimatiellota bacterium]MBL7011594.1 AmmeMemoRadiSam system protein B [Kiritimatiellales bacterium]